MMFVAIGLVLIWILFLSIVLLSNREIGRNANDSKQPFVSILISLRNEEDNVQTLCDSLGQLTYPNFEILLGDDDSDDSTLKWLEKCKPKNAQLFSYKNEDDSFGKQKVLAHLAKKSKGDFLLFTDADMQFHPDWIQGMLSQVSEGQQIVVGLTKVSGNDWWSKMQNMDWLFNEWIIGWFAGKGIGLTAWGNNLLISKSAYHEVGGYESLKQTIIEDVTLLRALKGNGGKLTANCDPFAVATTKPVSFYGYLNQRKRWMTGLLRMNPLAVIGGLIKWLFWPALIFLALGNPLWIMAGITILGLKFHLMSKIGKVTNSHILPFSLLLFEIYDFVFYLLTFAFYLLPIKIDWKGRKY
ncbi:MAG: glycosyltransferase [Reichenbachiella sp.]|uniref:glycosyltransferase n=1 Tax=Reichenbachiella sp. TaxID=2184521 RepID=UPI00296685A8|nr:glycosyltransferase [Reichenbachiella sp.]MDW3210187.1 glycosyltransferase [Reichenbachiella sp.]